MIALSGAAINWEVFCAIESEQLAEGGKVLTG